MQSTMMINEQKFYYALYSGTTLATDSQGYYTGEYTVGYGDPVECWGNISAARGEASVEQFGTDVKYDKIIVVCDPIPVDETSIIWIDAPSTEDHDYVVAKIAKSLNVMSIAVRKVDVISAPPSTTSPLDPSAGITDPPSHHGI